MVEVVTEVEGLAVSVNVPVVHWFVLVAWLRVTVDVDVEVEVDVDVAVVIYVAEVVVVLVKYSDLIGLCVNALEAAPIWFCEMVRVATDPVVWLREIIVVSLCHHPYDARNTHARS
jgi:hypothetical protein